MALKLLAAHELAEDVLACVCRTLEETAAAVPEQPGCPCRVAVVPGQAAWDSCDNPCDGEDETGGQLTVGIGRIYASTVDDFPSTEGRDRTVRGVRSCKIPQLIAVELVITLLRCVPVQDEDTGCPPPAEELAAAARVIHIDAASVYNALDCCLPTLKPRNGPRFVMQPLKVVGPQGGCGGIEQRVTVGLNACPCPTEESP